MSTTPSTTPTPLTTLPTIGNNSYALPSLTVSASGSGTNTFTKQLTTLSANATCACNPQSCGNPSTTIQTYGCAPNDTWTGNLTKGSRNQCTSAQQNQQNISNNCIPFVDMCGADQLNFNADSSNVISERGVMLFSGFGCNTSNYSWMEIIPDPLNTTPITLTSGGNGTSQWFQLASGNLIAKLRLVIYEYGVTTPSFDQTFTTNQNYAIAPYGYSLLNASQIASYQFSFPVPAVYNSSGVWTATPNPTNQNSTFNDVANGGAIASIYIPPHLQIQVASQANNTQLSSQVIVTEIIPGTGYYYAQNGNVIQLFSAPTPVPLVKGIALDQDGALRSMFYNGLVMPLYLFDLAGISIMDRGISKSGTQLGLGDYINVPFTQANGFQPSYFMNNIGPSSGKQYTVFHDSYKYCMYAACMNNPGTSASNDSITTQSANATALPYGPVNMAWKRALAQFTINPVGQPPITTADYIMGDYCTALNTAFAAKQTVQFDVACGCYQALNTAQGKNTPVLQIVTNTNVCPYVTVASCNAINAYVPNYDQVTCASTVTACTNLVNLQKDGKVDANGLTLTNACSGGGGTQTSDSNSKISENLETDFSTDEASVGKCSDNMDRTQSMLQSNRNPNNTMHSATQSLIDLMNNDKVIDDVDELNNHLPRYPYPNTSAPRPPPNSGYASPSLLDDVGGGNNYVNNSRTFYPGANINDNDTGSEYSTYGTDMMDDEEEAMRRQALAEYERKRWLLQQYEFARAEYKEDFKDTFDMNTPVVTLEAANDRYNIHKTRSMAIMIGGKLLILLVKGLSTAASYVPERFGIVKPRLDGWSDSIEYREMASFEPVLVKLWIKWFGSTGDMSPELELFLLLLMSGWAYHMASAFTQYIPEASVNQMRQALMQNPQIMNSALDGVGARMGVNFPNVAAQATNQQVSQATPPSQQIVNVAAGLPPQQTQIQSAPSQQSQDIPPQNQPPVDFQSMIQGVVGNLGNMFGGGAAGGANPFAALMGGAGGGTIMPEPPRNDAPVSRHVTVPEPYPVPPKPIPQTLNRNVATPINNDSQQPTYRQTQVTNKPHRVKRNRGVRIPINNSNNPDTFIQSLIRETEPMPESLTPMPEPITDNIRVLRAQHNNRVPEQQIEDSTDRHKMMFSNSLVNQPQILMLTPPMNG